MKIGDVYYLPCMDRLHWLAFKIDRVEYGWAGDHQWCGHAEAKHTCRGLDQSEMRWIREQDVAHVFTPDLPLPAFAHCWRCSIPLFQGLNVAETTAWLDCCQSTVFQCTTCVVTPWQVGKAYLDKTTTFFEWLMKVHDPVCARRCADCRTRINPELTWQCIGSGLKERAACRPHRCDFCYALHKKTCPHPVSRSASHRCPECDHRSIEMSDGTSGQVLHCLWCKHEWQAFYRGDKSTAWDKRSLVPGDSL